MTRAMFAICEKLNKLSDDDLIVLSDEAVAERKRRGLYPRKTYAPGYCNSYQKVQRDLRKKRNGRKRKRRTAAAIPEVPAAIPEIPVAMRAAEALRAAAADLPILEICSAVCLNNTFARKGL